RAEQPVPSSQSTSQRLSKQPNFYNYDLHDCQPGGFHTEIHMKRRRACFFLSVLTLATTHAAELTVNGPIESKSGGIVFPDGSIQTTAAATAPATEDGPA
ncbi:hypothetical protein, partial [Thiolapillus sp.]|uniref:hypothetical protein n=1 Tax=Thiolapillus sp. TaxID=2017437 RepID=UPI003AF7B43E